MQHGGGAGSRVGWRVEARGSRWPSRVLAKVRGVLAKVREAEPEPRHAQPGVLAKVRGGIKERPRFRVGASEHGWVRVVLCACRGVGGDSPGP